MPALLLSVIDAGVLRAAMAEPDRQGGGALRRRRRHRHDGARDRGPAEQGLNQTFVIENKPGAGGAIGVDYALHAPQDGYTILFVGSTLFTVLPLAQKVNYVPLKDLVPVSITGTNGMVMVVEKNAPYSTLREFIDYARANPGKITYSSGGAGDQQSPVDGVSRRARKGSIWSMCRSAAARPH